jgi:hypothetical protein
MTIVEPVKKSVWRRFIDGLIAWENAMDYSSGDYALDRVVWLEKQVAELRDELRQSPNTGPVDAVSWRNVPTASG